MTVFLQSFGGGESSCGEQCLCSAYKSLSQTEVSTCVNCLQSVRASDVEAISSLEQSCANATTSSTLSQTPSSTAAASSTASSAVQASSTVVTGTAKSGASRSITFSCYYYLVGMLSIFWGAMIR